VGCANLTESQRQLPCGGMRTRILTILFLGALFCGVAPGSIIFRPGQKAKVLAPGEEEINGNAQELFHIAEEAEAKGDLKRAIKACIAIFRKYPKDMLAPSAAYHAAQLLEQTHDYLKAAQAYAVVVEKYPGVPTFEEAIEAQFRIGEMFLAGKRTKFLGITLATSLDRAVAIFAEVVRTAPYGKHTARAQFDIGLARQKQGANDAAVQAYQAVVDKFPNDPIAADAQYQIGYLWFEAARQGTNDSAATANAKTGFEDFLFKYPKSEKAPQARENLAKLEQKATGDAFKIAKYYDKQKAYRAAVIYYSEVIREQPSSPASDQAKRRIDQIRAKVGESALQPAIAVNDKKKNVASRGQASGKPQLRGGDAEVAPLPPPEQDSALPPPASLQSPPTTAPETSPTPEPEASPAPSESEASPTPSDTAASPAP
jgi:outer membrane protein assembly factor BamD